MLVIVFSIYMSTHNDLGKLGERLALPILKSHGYEIIDTNIRFRFGEIDVLALHEGCVVAIEVKTRTSKTFAHIHRSLDINKCKRIAKGLGTLYPSHVLRIDALCVCIDGHQLVDCRLLKNIYREE